MPRELMSSLGRESDVQVTAGRLNLEATLYVPVEARGIVLFAHGSGSSRHSPRNRFVAGELQQAGMATLLLDLLTREEEAVDLRTARLRFDIELLSQRLAEATDWVTSFAETKDLGIGYFGASTGAAAALVAAAEKSDDVQAVVSRGGRPDLAGPSLRRVGAPTLLIVGGNDFGVIELNEEALRQLPCQKQLAVVSRATHLFEEPGALEQVATLATNWFREHLRSRSGIQRAS
jgi:putative phosphoribosyl transferase